MPSTQIIRDAIRESFAFLLKQGYAEVPASPQSDEIYAEVHFQKDNWRVAVLTTAHNTQVTTQIISPDGKRGFLSHLGKCRSGADIISDIKCKAEFLNKHGADLLLGNSNQLQSVLETVTERQQEWMKRVITGQQGGVE